MNYEGMISTEKLMNFKDYYKLRVAGLESMKKKVNMERANSYRNLQAADSDPIDPMQGDPKNSVNSETMHPAILDKLFTLKNNMVNLMEMDVYLMRQLMGVHDTIGELKLSSVVTGCATLIEEESISRSDSISSIHEDDEDIAEPMLHDFTDKAGKFSPSRTSTPEHPGRSKQYFSRQNSVLRIPIHKSNHLNNIRSMLPRSRNTSVPTLTVNDEETSDDTSSGFSSHSESGKHGRRKLKFTKPATKQRIASEADDDSEGVAGAGCITVPGSKQTPTEDLQQDIFLTARCSREAEIEAAVSTISDVRQIIAPESCVLVAEMPPPPLPVSPPPPFLQETEVAEPVSHHKSQGSIDSGIHSPQGEPTEVFV